MKKLIIILLFGITLSAYSQVQLTSTGSGNAYALTFPGVYTYTSGIQVTFKANFTNTGAATINITNSAGTVLGAKTIKKQASADLSANDILSGQVVTLVYDGTNFQMVSASGSTISSQAWSLIGNSGTTAGTNFIGTTDAVDLVFNTGGSSSAFERMRINSSGNVGIGSTSPGAKLYVYGSNDPLILLDAPASSQSVLGFATAGVTKWSWYLPSGGADLSLWHYASPSQNYLTFDGANGNIKMVPTAGSVIIANPSYTTDALNIGGTTLFDNQNVAATDFTIFEVRRAGTHRWDVVEGSASGLKFRQIYNDAGTNQGFATRLELMDNGNVYIANNLGVGTSAPSTLLTLNKDAVLSTNTGQIKITDPDNTTRGLQLGYEQVPSVSTFAFIQTSPDGGGVYPDLTIQTNGGNIGVGTTSPSSKLEVVGNTEIPAANEYKYSTAKTKRYTVSNVGFSKTDESTGYVLVRNGTYYVGASGGTVGVAAQMAMNVNLPDGAIVTQIKPHFYDANATYDCSIDFMSSPSAATAANILATVSSSGSGGHIFPTVATTITIDNDTNAYYLVFNTKENTFPGAGYLILYTVEITYTITHAD